MQLLERDDEFGDGWFLGKHLLNPNSGLFPEGELLPCSCHQRRRVTSTIETNCFWWLDHLDTRMFALRLAPSRRLSDLSFLSFLLQLLILNYQKFIHAPPPKALSQLPPPSNFLKTICSQKPLLHLHLLQQLSRLSRPIHQYDLHLTSRPTRTQSHGH